MKLQLLRKIVNDYAAQLQSDAEWENRPYRNDGGSSALQNKLRDFELKLMRANNLSPDQLDSLSSEIEVEDPREFSDAIEHYKRKLAANIKL